MANSVLIANLKPNFIFSEPTCTKAFFGTEFERGSHYAAYDFNESFRNVTFGSPKDTWKKFQNIVLCSEFFSKYLHIPKSKMSNFDEGGSPFKRSTLYDPFIQLHPDENVAVADPISFAQSLTYNSRVNSSLGSNQTV